MPVDQQDSHSSAWKGRSGSAGPKVVGVYDGEDGCQE